MYRLIAADIDDTVLDPAGKMSDRTEAAFRKAMDAGAYVVLASGRSFEWTVRNGVNAMMRLPQNDRFYRNDPDCAAFTSKVPAEINLDFLEMCALTGVTTLASVTPGILTNQQLARIQKIYATADRDAHRYGIIHFEKTALPEIFEQNGNRKEYNWSSVYDGSRIQLNWVE